MILAGFLDRTEELIFHTKLNLMLGLGHAGLSSRKENRQEV